MSSRDLVDYTALALLWGLSFAVVLEVVEAFGWAGATSFRALVAGAVLFALAAARRRKLRLPPVKLLAVIGATTVAAQQIGLTLAAPRIGTSMAAILVATIPLFSMLISHAWGLEHISPAPADFAYLLLLGAAMSALTYVLFFRLVADLGPTKAISSEFAVTVVAVIAGALLLHERLSLAQFAGAVVIIVGCCLILGPVPQRSSNP